MLLVRTFACMWCIKQTNFGNEGLNISTYARGGARRYGIMSQTKVGD
nr:MAG TPA: hypothetical protein [Caudoviricetes sp.]